MSRFRRIREAAILGIAIFVAALLLHNATNISNTAPTTGYATYEMDEQPEEEQESACESDAYRATFRSCPINLLLIS